jgi:hypothetical protein
MDEEIGALLDGRVDERRRTELLTLLAADDADYDVFADTAAVLREAEEGASGKEAEPEEEARGGAKVIPLRPRRAGGWRNSPAQWMALAAAVAALALVPVLRSRMNGDRWRDPDRLATLATQPGEPLPSGWTDSIPWDRTRGGGSTAQETGVAARVGARSTDLVVAARSGDRVGTPMIAREIAFTLDNVSGSGFVAAEYREIADSATWPRPIVVKKVTDAHDNLATIVDRDYLALGTWSEAARLAAKRQNAAFFRLRESRKALERATSAEGLNDAGKAAATRLRLAVEQGEVRDWTSLRNDLDELLRELAR